jgi:phosphoribosylaminoimidazole (AIR) synthetase
MTDPAKIVVTMAHSHLRRVDRASPRQIRKMAATAVYKACAKLKAEGTKPLCLVDDLSMHSAGPWIDDFAYGLTAAAKREGVSIVGGEMAQMRDSYAFGYVGVVVYVTGIK